MASPKYTVGDTYPPIRGMAKDENGPVDLTTADEVKFLAVGKTTVFEGDVVIINPPEDVGDSASPLGYNWHYVLAAGDTATPGDFTPWLKITWDAASTPPLIEWLPGGDKITIVAAPE